MRDRYRHPISFVRAVAWAERARRTAERIAADGLGVATLSPAPELAPCARRYVERLLDRRGSACLVRSLVLQRFDLAQGTPRDVVIGVRTLLTDEPAHAWLDGDGDGVGYQELTRLAPP